MLHIAEVLRHGQSGQAHSHSGPGRLVHLAKDQRGLFQHPAFAHLGPQVVALAGALSHAGKDGIAAMLGGYIGDQLLDKHCFAYARAAKKADFTALGVGGQQVNDLDAGLQDLHHGALVGKAGRVAVDAPLLPLRQRLDAINNLTSHIKEPPQGTVAHRHLDAAAFSGDLHLAAQPLTGGKHDAAHDVAAHMLGHLHHALLLAVLHRQRILDEGQLALGEQDIHHRPLHLCNNPFHHDVFFLFCALAPPATSTICWVMAACRTLL